MYHHAWLSSVRNAVLFPKLSMCAWPILGTRGVLLGNSSAATKRKKVSPLHFIYLNINFIFLCIIYVRVRLYTLEVRDDLQGSVMRQRTFASVAELHTSDELTCDLTQFSCLCLPATAQQGIASTELSWLLYPLNLLPGPTHIIAPWLCRVTLKRDTDSWRTAKGLYLLFFFYFALLNFPKIEAYLNFKAYLGKHIMQTL